MMAAAAASLEINMAGSYTYANVIDFCACNCKPALACASPELSLEGT